MKWSWRAFGLQLVVTLVLGIGLAYGISMAIDAKRGPEAPDSTLISLATGGLIAPLVLALIAGWKGWIPMPPLVVAFIVAGIYASNPAIGVLCLMASTALYSAARRGRQVLSYFAPPKDDASKPGMASTE